MESYQGLLTDLSDVCRRSYWVLLWGLTRGYWPTFQMVCMGVLPDLTDRPHRGLYGLLPGVCMESYQGLLTDLSSISMKCYLGLLTDLSSVCMGCYWVLVWSLTRGYWPTFQMVCMGCYLTLLTDLSNGLYGVLLDLTDRLHRGMDCYWVFVWSVTRVYWPTFQVFVWTVIGCYYKVLPECIDRPFRCL